MSAPNDDRLFALMEEIESAWTARRDNTLVHELAAKHPDLAEELYLFFADVVGVPEALGDKPERLGAIAQRIEKWVESEGFTLAAAARSSATETTQPSGRQPAQPATPVPKIKSFLGFLKESTGEGAVDLAAALDITVDFLADLSTNAAVLSNRARIELAKRAHKARGIDERLLLSSLELASTSQLQRAASREAAYNRPSLTYEELVTRSRLDAERKRFWLELA